MTTDIVDQIYDNDEQGWLRIIADELRVGEETSPRGPRITTQQRPTSDQQGIVSTKLSKPAYIGITDNHYTVSSSPRGIQTPLATIQADLGRPPSIQSYKDTLITFLYKKDKGANATHTDDGKPLLTRSQIGAYLRDDHTEDKEAGLTKVYFNTVRKSNPLRIANQKTYNIRRALHYSQIHIEDQTDNPSLVKDRNIDHYYQ